MIQVNKIADGLKASRLAVALRKRGYTVRLSYRAGAGYCVTAEKPPQQPAETDYSIEARAAGSTHVGPRGHHWRRNPVSGHWEVYKLCKGWDAAEPSQLVAL